MKSDQSKTIQYYQKHGKRLIVEYEQADMSKLHSFLMESLNPKGNILDIGFGSGRELNFLRQQDFKIWGVDPSLEFVRHAKQRFSDLSNHFFLGALPDLNMPSEFNHFFDNIVLIAVWMHLPKTLRKESINSLLRVLKPNGKIVLSYNITNRQDDPERFYENMNQNEIQKDFELFGFKRFNSMISNDKLANREIQWITEAYCHDQL
jgi:SAM-dependent methyltransferase